MPQGDHADVHAQLQKVHGGRVRQTVRRDRSPGQTRRRERGGLDGQCQALRNVGSRLCLSAAIGQQRRRGSQVRVAPQPGSDHFDRRLRSQNPLSLLPPVH